MKSWDDIKATLYFYRFNPHSIPFIKSLFCKMGRHDFELMKVLNNHSATLECFYCSNKKTSTISKN